MEADIRAALPDIDPVLSEYSVGYLRHASTAWHGEDETSDLSPLAEAAFTVTELLLSASGDIDSAAQQDKIRALVAKWVEKYEEVNGSSRERHGPSVVKRLDHAYQVGSQRNMSSTLAVATGGVDLESANTRKVESKVDRKKLEKAERKIAAKQNKKQFKNVEYEASRLLNQPESQSYEEFYMAVNPLQLGIGGGTAKTKDIKIENADVSIGGTRILTGTDLTLAYGHRYGLVGNNGVGKSTLLRALSRRELPIPTHISILHVEQEVSYPSHDKKPGTSANAEARLLEMTQLPCKPFWMPTYGERSCLKTNRCVAIHCARVITHMLMRVLRTYPVALLRSSLRDHPWLTHQLTRQD